MSNLFTSGPFLPNTFSFGNGRKGSDEYGPDEIAPGEVALSSTKHTPEDGRLTHLETEAVPTSTDEIVKPSPAHQAYTAADRRSTSATLQDIPPSSPFSKPLYDRPSQKNRISKNIGPDELSTSSSSFSKPSNGPPGDPKESMPDQSTKPTRSSLGPGDWESSSVSPGQVDSINNSAAGGVVGDANPFFAYKGFGNRSSKNFSKKVSNIVVPEDGVRPSDYKPSVETPVSTTTTMVNTPTQTPLRTSFASSHEPKRSRPGSVAFAGLSPSEDTARLGSTDLTPPSSRKPSTIANNRRTSTAGPPSAINSRRPSLAGPRRSSVSVTNVVIPAHLMTHVETNWNEDKVVGRRKSAYQREDSRKSFNIQSMAQQQQEEIKNIINTTPQAPRHMSESMEALSQADPFAATRERQASARKSRGKSLAAVSEKEKASNDEEEEEEDEKPMPPALSEKSEGLTPWGKFSFNYRDGGVSPGAAVDPADPMAAAGADLGLDKTNGAADTNTTTRRPSVWRYSASADLNNANVGARRPSIFQRAGSVFQDTVQNVRKKVRRSSMWDVYENAKKRQIEIRRKRWVQILFEYCFYAMLVVLVYFLIIGEPLWKGTYYELYEAFKYKLNVTGSWSVIIAVAVAYAYSPLLVLFEPDPPMPEEPIDATKTANVADTALMIPCYKAANLIGPTLVAALKVFPPSHIFVVANGNSPTPLDETEEVCRPYGVNHIWSPVGSKIVAQFVGCYAAKDFKNVLLIDDDCALPPNFPIVSDRLKGKVMCMGYTIKSVGPNSSKGTLCQQAQDLEYKISGIQRALAGKIGSATFPHGAISLWDREFLIKTFNKHPGFSVSEDWFFGHVARQLGCRTQMATSVFIETETPPAVFFSSGGSRGGFGEMTVFKQRFLRWNFFFVNGMYYNLHYILFSWELGFWEIGTKLFVFQEIYETLLYLATPIVVPVSLAVRPQFFFELMALTFVLYMANAVIFNELHLRRKNEKVPQKCVWFYYMPYKLVLTFVNVASCYYAIFKYATYFANRHPKIIEDDKAVNVVLQLEEEDVEDDPVLPAGGRRMSVTAVGSQVDVPGGAPGGRRMTITAMGQRFGTPDITITEEDEEEEAEQLIEKPARKASINIVKTGEAPAPFEARRPSITVDGRRISISSATVIDEVPSHTRRTSDAFQSKGLFNLAPPTTTTPNGRRSSDAFKSKGINESFAQAARSKLSTGRSSVNGIASVLEEPEEEEEAEAEEEGAAAAAKTESNDNNPVSLPTSNVESQRRAKRKSQLNKSYTRPSVTETEVVPAASGATRSLDDRLLNRISAIEDALAVRGIGAVEFTVHDDGVAGKGTDEEVGWVAAEDGKKHSDANSMV